MSIIVGIAGHKGAGKDTCAKTLISSRNFKKLSFAEPLKRAMTDLFGFEHKNWDDLKWKETPNSLCYGHTPRYIAQTFGTDWGRKMVHPNIWVHATLRAAAKMRRVVIPDVRFNNEAEAIREAGGVVIEVRKTGYVNQDGHVSEQGIDPVLVDAVVEAAPGHVAALETAFLWRACSLTGIS
jgi:hypothetical protein